LAQEQSRTSRAAPSKNLELVERLKKVAARYKTVPGAIASPGPCASPPSPAQSSEHAMLTRPKKSCAPAKIKLTPQDITEIEATAAAQVAR